MTTGRLAAIGGPAQMALVPGAGDAVTKFMFEARLARTLMQRGKPHDAAALADRLLQQRPTDVELLHLKAQCLEMAKNVPGAFSTYMSVLSVDPAHLPSILSLGGLYKSRAMLEDAHAAFARAFELAPDNIVVREALALVLADLGTRRKAQGATQDALAKYQQEPGQSYFTPLVSGTEILVTSSAALLGPGLGDENAPPLIEPHRACVDTLAKYQQAVILCPACAAAHYNLGVITSDMHQFDAALGHYQQAVAIQPCYPQALCNMGVIYKERGELTLAVTCYERALSVSPNFGIVQANLAIALTDLGTRVKMEGEVDEAIELYERALVHNPKYTDAMYNLGVAFGEQGKVEKAMFMYQLALNFNPGCAEAYNNLGVIYKERDNVDRAVECYIAALSIRPSFPQSLNNLGVMYTSQGKSQEALTLLTAAIQACPTYAEAYNNLGVLQRDVGAIADAINSYSRCLELTPDSRNAGQNRLLALNYMYQGEDAIVCNAHADWGARFSALHPPLAPLTPGRDVDLDPERRLNVGYISPDLFTHSVSYFAHAPLAHHRAGSHVRHTAYCCAPKYDAKTSRLRAAVEAAGGTWRDVAALTEAQLAAQVREDKIDILVELTGHTANNRLGALAMRPAPIQVTWIGYPNSTGLPAVDYRFTDELCDPVDTKQTFVEELVRLPSCFLCYTPAHDAPPVSELPALTNGYITFGSFNNLAKMGMNVIGCWARILNRVPHSRLVLKNKPFACDSAKAHFLNQLAVMGVDPARVDLLPLLAANSDHLSTYAFMDISLDPFPYAGTTTTCEALFMGVPCVTLIGGCHAHNVGVSLLNATGVSEGWVAGSEDEYVELAVRHADPENRSELAALRAGLRERMLSSRMCDAKGFVSDLEDTYRGLWRRYVAQQAATATSTAVATAGATNATAAAVAGACGEGAGGAGGARAPAAQWRGGGSDGDGSVDEGGDESDKALRGHRGGRAAGAGGAGGRGGAAAAARRGGGGGDDDEGDSDASRTTPPPQQHARDMHQHPAHPQLQAPTQERGQDQAASGGGTPGAAIASAVMLDGSGGEAGTSGECGRRGGGGDAGARRAAAAAAAVAGGGGDSRCEGDCASRRTDSSDGSMNDSANVSEVRAPAAPSPSSAVKGAGVGARTKRSAVGR
ncbi:hypothetical protein FOA52_004883 [Chlamydomonas sp. UWO 241]|nr:hypothetical protein FOA52_004883 [Chlamydomonas sp. UWO 241]